MWRANGSRCALKDSHARSACISPASSLLLDDMRPYRVFIAPFVPAFITFVADDARAPHEVFTMGAFAARGAAMLTRLSAGFAPDREARAIRVRIATASRP
ncbi:hypothetical protein G3N97_35230 [Paraburkholderia sp. Ac-20347]|nr:hypothetical protein [Paraburkholderia sp. Ac-20347]